MSMLLLNCVIHQIPKAGSSLIADVLWLNRIPYLDTHSLQQLPMCFGDQHTVMGRSSSHCIPVDGRYNWYKHALSQGEKIGFLSVVRHPLGWLRSWWRYKEEHLDHLTGRSWREHSPFDRECCSHDFNEFIDLVIEQYPGIVSKFFKSYIDESTHVVKLKEIQAGLVGFLKEFEDRPVNVWPNDKVNEGEGPNAFFTRAQASKLMELEEFMVKAFGYDYVKEAWVK